MKFCGSRLQSYKTNFCRNQSVLLYTVKGFGIGESNLDVFFVSRSSLRIPQTLSPAVSLDIEELIEYAFPFDRSGKTFCYTYAVRYLYHAI